MLARIPLDTRLSSMTAFVPSALIRLRLSDGARAAGRGARAGMRVRMSSSASNRDIVARTARLAHLKLTDDEIDQIAPDFEKILGFVEKINDLDVSDSDPVTFIAPLQNVLREDVPKSFPRVDDILNEVPVAKDDRIIVPKIELK